MADRSIVGDPANVEFTQVSIKTKNDRNKKPMKKTGCVPGGQLATPSQLLKSQGNCTEAKGGGPLKIGCSPQLLLRLFLPVPVPTAAGPELKVQ